MTESHRKIPETQRLERLSEKGKEDAEKHTVKRRIARKERKWTAWGGGGGGGKKKGNTKG